jgi:hypothetical protein
MPYDIFRHFEPNLHCDLIDLKNIVRIILIPVKAVPTSYTERQSLS